MRSSSPARPHGRFCCFPSPCSPVAPFPSRPPPEISYDDDGAAGRAGGRSAKAGRGRRNTKAATASRTAQAIACNAVEAGARRSPQTGRKSQRRGPRAADPQWLHQCRPGLSVCVGRALSGLCRAGAGDRCRPAGRRAACRLRTGRGRRYRTLDHRRYREWDRSDQAHPYPGQANAGRSSSPISSSIPTGAPISWSFVRRRRPTWPRCPGNIRRIS